jgi:hypothetical protein
MSISLAWKSRRASAVDEYLCLGRALIHSRLGRSGQCGCKQPSRRCRSRPASVEKRKPQSVAPVGGHLPFGYPSIGPCRRAGISTNPCSPWGFGSAAGLTTDPPWDHKWRRGGLGIVNKSLRQRLGPHPRIGPDPDSPLGAPLYDG